MRPLYVIIGKSGSGKSSYIKKFMDCHKGYSEALTYTTRAPRGKDDIGHTFLSSIEEYNNLDNKIATSHFAGNYYCVTKEQLDHCDFVTLDVKGVIELINNYQCDRIINIVYIDINCYYRFVRLIKRDGLKGGTKRFIRDIKEFRSLRDKILKRFSLTDRLRVVSINSRDFDTNYKEFERAIQED